MFALICLSLLIGPWGASGLEKRWLADVEWQSPDNWLDGSAPGPDSLVIFPLEMRHALGMPRSAGRLSLAGVQLSRDGLLALPENGIIAVSELTKARQQARWQRETPFFWVDPLNWNGSSEAVPHLERLPCQSDLAVLPASSRTFSVRLPVTRDVEVRGVRLADGDEVLSRWAWRDMNDRPEFFGADFTVKYSPSECKDCPCQEGDMSAYWEEVCDVQRPRCGLLACENPLKVEGHCCFYCGGRIRISKKALPSSVERLAGAVLKDYEDALFWHSRVTWDGEREILITERGSYQGSNTIIAVARLEAKLKEEELEVLYSETSGEPLGDYRLLMALGPMFGILLAMILLTLVLCPLFGYTFAEVWEACRELGAAICIEDHRGTSGRKAKSFAFARFENISEGGNVQLADEQGTQQQQHQQQQQQQQTGETFENPLYRTHQQQQQQQKRMNTREQAVSLVSLEKAIELDRMEDVDMDIENF